MSERTPIASAEAKTQLERINAVLPRPFVLVGGLAVQQYVLHRLTYDIDLICDYETARSVVAQLYPSDEWTVHDANEDEYRPSIHAKHKFDDKIPIVKFGPKILERESYDGLDWNKLHEGAAPFRHKKSTLERILIPSLENLCLTKVIAFLGRTDDKSSKLAQDLADLTDLSNNDEFRLGVFMNLLRKTGVDCSVKDRFFPRVRALGLSFEKSHLHRAGAIFGAEAVRAESLEVAKERAGAPPTLDAHKSLPAEAGLAAHETGLHNFMWFDQISWGKYFEKATDVEVFALSAQFLLSHQIDVLRRFLRRDGTKFIFFTYDPTDEQGLWLFDDHFGAPRGDRRTKIEGVLRELDKLRREPETRAEIQVRRARGPLLFRYTYYRFDDLVLYIPYRLAPLRSPANIPVFELRSGAFEEKFLLPDRQFLLKNFLP